MDLGNGATNSISMSDAEKALLVFLAKAGLTLPADLFTRESGAFSMTTGDSSQNWGSGFYIRMDQRHKGLPVFDSSVVGMVGPTGRVASADNVVLYVIEERDGGMPLMSPTVIAEIAAKEMHVRHGDIPCKISGMLFYYGYPLTQGNSVEVRPVCGIEFDFGRAVCYIDAVTGQVLEVDKGETPKK